jgi:hypothetical protein
MQSACAVLYCHQWPVWFYRILPHLIKGTIFGKQLLIIKCVFWFSLQILSETLLILRRIQRDIVINVHKSLCKVPLLLSEFNQKNFSTYFAKKKYSNITFHENPSSGSRVVSFGRTDGQTDRHESNSRFPQFCERAKKDRENYLWL